MKESKRSVLIPMNPKAGYLAHKEQIDAAVRRVLDSGWYILGREVDAFEREFADYTGVRHAMGTGSGTDALTLALNACGAGPGDLVFTVSHTAVATVAAIELAGATPVFVDIDPRSFTMDPDSLAEALVHAPAGNPKAVIPVHLFGQPADMRRIMDVARQWNLVVVEDCAQSHGAVLAGRKTGAWGDLAAFSFYPTKNLGGLGDGGMVVTSNKEWAQRIRLVQQYGWNKERISEIPGGNSRLDELQAAILRVRLSFLDQENSRRRHLAALYTSLLAQSGLVLPEARVGAEHVFHQYAVLSSQRDGLREGLAAEGIGTLIHYPVPVHLQPAYRDRVPCPVSLVNTEETAQRILSLPMYPQLSDEMVCGVAEAGVRCLRAAEGDGP